MPIRNLRLINVGEAPNDNKGDPLRTIFIKINELISAINGDGGLSEFVDENFRAEANKSYYIDNRTNTGAIVMHLPLEPKFGDTFSYSFIRKVGGGPVHIDTGTSKLNGTTGLITAPSQDKAVVFISEEIGWITK